MKFKDIKQFKRSWYRVDINWDFLEKKLADWETLKKGLELNPDFQRGHVWVEEQQSKYVEFILRDGLTGRDIFLNCPGWMSSFIGPMQMVDGLQRVTAVRLFLNNKIKVFGKYFKEFEGNLPSQAAFTLHINDMTSREEIISWYLELNSGGVVHTEDELNKVKKLLEKCKNI